MLWRGQRRGAAPWAQPDGVPEVAPGCEHILLAGLALKRFQAVEKWHLIFVKVKTRIAGFLLGGRRAPAPSGGSLVEPGRGDGVR